ncbi:MULTISPECIES: hypothetical protein [Mycobacterium]|nr:MULTISPECIES: hypothetical protein [Mycobacterium]
MTRADDEDAGSVSLRGGVGVAPATRADDEDAGSVSLRGGVEEWRP